jgi:predicted ATP-grasp superfamily ATP-dependent carboligase
VRVLVLDGNENQAVAATRSLAEAGHRVEVGAETSWSKAGWSRHARRTFQYPAPQHAPDAFVHALAERASIAPGTLVLPMTEKSTLPISEHRALLENAGARLVLPSHAQVLQAFDKDHTTRLARSVGLHVPETTTLGSHDDVAAVAARTRYPVVLKPRMSEEASATGASRTTGAPLYARSPDELIAAWHAMRARCDAMLLQEFVEGTGAGYFALVQHGTVITDFGHRRLRDVRPTGSGSALRESVAVDPHLRAAAQRLLSALRWHGVAMVEFRVRDDGTPVFLEVNGRFWNSLALARYAGVHFPVLLAELAAEASVRSAPVSYRQGVRCRWWLGDVRHLVEVMRGAPPSYPGRFPSRLTTLLQFTVPRRGTYHDNFEWSDPLPELGDWIHFLVRRLPAYARPAPARETQHA